MLSSDATLAPKTGWQNQGYACYIVTRTYTEKVGLIDWRIGKGKGKGKKREIKKIGMGRREKKKENEKKKREGRKN